jgi:hypothetical protein
MTLPVRFTAGTTTTNQRALCGIDIVAVISASRLAPVFCSRLAALTMKARESGPTFEHRITARGGWGITLITLVAPSSRPSGTHLKEINTSVERHLDEFVFPGTPTTTALPSSTETPSATSSGTKHLNVHFHGTGALPAASLLGRIPTDNRMFGIQPHYFHTVTPIGLIFLRHAYNPPSLK